MRSITLTAAALAAAALAAAGCGTGPGQITIRGKIMGVTSDSAYTVGKAFGAMPSVVCDVTGAAQVKILGAQGQELAWAQLKPGTVISLPGTPGQGTEIWTFTATVPAGQTQYGVQVGSMPPLAMTRAEIASPDLTC